MSVTLSQAADSVPDLYPLIRPLLYRLPRETAHRLSLHALRSGLGRIVASDCRQPHSALLEQRIWGLNFPNPLGLAAGYDKDALAPDALLRLGFGFVEIGTVTPRPQPGNSKPRLFRLDEDRAAINRMGFNSAGSERVAAQLARRRRAGIVGVNLGKNRDSADAAADYAAGIRRMAALADYLVVNISSPNTPGLRDLQARAALDRLLRQLTEARDQAGGRVPLLLKIAPDLSAAERRDIAEVSLAAGIDGMIVSNTTIGRPAGLCSRHAAEAGGLSGRPLFAPSTAVLADMYRLTAGRIPLIGVGGVADAAGAYAKIRAGAALLQVYTALVFDGPALVGRICRELAELLRRDGFNSVVEAIGSGVDEQRAMQPAVATVASAGTEC
jgi:dihydroorotate dehydrogenase